MSKEIVANNQSIVLPAELQGAIRHTGTLCTMKEFASLRNISKPADMRQKNDPAVIEWKEAMSEYALAKKQFSQRVAQIGALVSADKRLVGKKAQVKIDDNGQIVDAVLKFSAPTKADIKSAETAEVASQARIIRELKAKLQAAGIEA
jgi:hypothetical protein